MTRTYVIRSNRDQLADGLDLKAEDQIAVVTTDLPLLTLLGMIQFHSASVEEVEIEAGSESDDDADDGEGEASVEGEAGEGEASQSEASQLEDDVIGSKPADATEGEGGEAGSEGDDDADDGASDLFDAAFAAFTVEGLEPKIATALAEQGETPDSIREKLAAGFDLTTLDDIGGVRADKIILALAPSEPSDNATDGDGETSVTE